MTPPTVTTDEQYFERALARLRAAILWLSLGGGIVALVAFSWRHGLGFLAGALASYLNFRWLHQLAASVGEQTRKPRRRLLLFLLLRYFILGTAGYVIVKIFGLSLAALLAGLFVAAAAVIVEILYELIYARA